MISSKRMSAALLLSVTLAVAAVAFAEPAMGPVEVSSGERRPIWSAPQTAAINSGRQLVVWLEAEAHDTPRQVWGRAIGRDGLPLGSEFPISRAVIDGKAVSAESPTVAARGRRGEFLVVWSQRIGDEDNRNLVARRLDTRGGRVSGEFAVTGKGDFASASGPSIAYGARRDEFVIAWAALPPEVGSGPTEVGHEVHVARLRGGRSGTPRSVRISSMGAGPKDEYGGVGPAIAYNPGRRDYLVVWDGEAPELGRRSLFARTLPARSKGDLGRVREVSRGQYADLAFNRRAGEYVVTGIVSHSAVQAVGYARRIRPNGAARGRVIRIAGDEFVDGGSDLYEVGPVDIEARSGRGYRVVFDGRDFSSDRFEVFTRGLGRKLKRGRARLVAGGEQDVSAGSSALAVMSRNRQFRVVWTERHEDGSRSVLIRGL
jgi:hypothetical protein